LAADDLTEADPNWRRLVANALIADCLIWFLVAPSEVLSVLPRLGWSAPTELTHFYRISAVRVLEICAALAVGWVMTIPRRDVTEAVEQVSPRALYRYWLTLAAAASLARLLFGNYVNLRAYHIWSVIVFTLDAGMIWLSLAYVQHLALRQPDTAIATQTPRLKWLRTLLWISGGWLDYCASLAGLHGNSAIREVATVGLIGYLLTGPWKVFLFWSLARQLRRRDGV
jgi:hypothetical protein